MEKWLPRFIDRKMKEVCSVYRGGDLVDIYYGVVELKNILEGVAVMSQDVEKAKQQIGRFLELFDQLKPYFTQAKEPGDMEEFRKIYELYGEYWALVAVIYVIGSLPKANPELRKMGQQVREKTQEYNEAMEPVFKKFLEKEFPHLKNKTRFVLPEEVWSGQAREPSIIKKIDKRKKGFLFYKGDLYTGSIDRTLSGLGVELGDKEDLFVKIVTRDFAYLMVVDHLIKKYKDETGIDGENFGVLYYSNKKGVRLYNNKEKREHVLNLIKERVDKNYIEKIIKKHSKVLEKIKPYLNKSKVIKDKKSLEVFYSDFIRFFILLDIIQLIGDLEGIKGVVRKAAIETRKETHFFTEKADEVLQKSLKKVLSKYSEDEISVLMYDEVFGHKKVDKDELKKRINGYLYYEGNVYVGDEINKIIESHNIKFEDEGTKEGELKGQIAQKGIVRGIVKLVSSVKHLDKVKEGDILVTAMTMPKYLPAMKRAAAFVTDEGGITCHAAIISREMKKPCVIGTKTATKVLKDGDVVEVDATHGKATIIERKR